MLVLLDMMMEQLKFMNGPMVHVLNMNIMLKKIKSVQHGVITGKIQNAGQQDLVHNNHLDVVENQKEMITNYN